MVNSSEVHSLAYHFNFSNLFIDLRNKLLTEKNQTAMSHNINSIVFDNILFLDSYINVSRIRRKLEVELLFHAYFIYPLHGLLA